MVSFKNWLVAIVTVAALAGCAALPFGDQSRLGGDTFPTENGAVESFVIDPASLFGTITIGI